MSIGTTIKKLRQEREITQEQLAEYLGVSKNAVSQWECDKTAPDISHIPVLANIFEVSADILLEIDLAKSRKQAEINEFVQKYTELHSRGEIEARLSLCRAMQKKYPNDETVRYHLMRVLQNGYMDESFDEIVSIGEQLLSSSDLEYKTGAIRGLCFAYLHRGDRAKALEYAKMLPVYQDLYVHVLEGEELADHCRDYFWKVCDHMYLRMRYLLSTKDAGYTCEEKHTAWKTLYDMFHMLFPDGDFGFWEDRLVRISFFMAMESMRAKNPDRALSELEQMVAHVEAYGQFTAVSHTSLLVRGLRIDQNNISKHTSEPLGEMYLRYLTNHEAEFAPLLSHERYLRVKEALARPYLPHNMIKKVSAPVCGYLFDFFR